MRYFLLLCILLFYFLLSIFYPNYFRETTYDTFILFLKVIIPSIAPMYIISSLLINNKIFVRITNILLNKFAIFESINSSSLFFINMLVGNPTTAIFVLNSYKQNLITKKDTTKLLSCSFINPIFVINIFKLSGFKISFAYLFIISSIIGNLLLVTRRKRELKINKLSLEKVSLVDIINSLSTVILNIFFITLVIYYMKIPIIAIDNIPTFIKILFSFLEVSTGFISISYLNINLFLKIILLVLLLSSTGFCIIYQTIFFIKEKAPTECRYFIKSLLIHKFYGSTIICLIFIILFKLLF